MRRLSYDIVANVTPSGSLKSESMTVLVRDRVTREQLVELANNLTKQYRPDHVEFVDYGEFAVGTPSLGGWRPEDDSRLREKDW